MMKHIRGNVVIQGTTEQQVMIGGVGASGGNALLTYFDAYGPMISSVMALTTLTVVIISFFLDVARKNRKELREKRREDRDIAEHEKRMNDET